MSETAQTALAVSNPQSLTYRSATNVSNAAQGTAIKYISRFASDPSLTDFVLVVSTGFTSQNGAVAVYELTRDNPPQLNFKSYVSTSFPTSGLVVNPTRLSDGSYFAYAISPGNNDSDPRNVVFGCTVDKAGNITALSGPPTLINAVPSSGTGAATISNGVLYIMLNNENVQSSEARIAAFSIDSASGELTKLASSPWDLGSIAGSALAVSSDGKVLYALTGCTFAPTGTGTLSAYALAADGSLASTTPLSTISTRTNAPNMIEVTPTSAGDRLYVPEDPSAQGHNPHLQGQCLSTFAFDGQILTKPFPHLETPHQVLVACVDSWGKNLYALGTGAAWSYPINGDGSLGTATAAQNLSYSGQSRDCLVNPEVAVFLALIGNQGLWNMTPVIDLFTLSQTVSPFSISATADPSILNIRIDYFVDWTRASNVQLRAYASTSPSPGTDTAIWSQALPARVFNGKINVKNSDILNGKYNDKDNVDQKPMPITFALVGNVAGRAQSLTSQTIADFRVLDLTNITISVGRSHDRKPWLNATVPATDLGINYADFAGEAKLSLLPVSPSIAFECSLDPDFSTVALSADSGQTGYGRWCYAYKTQFDTNVKPYASSNTWFFRMSAKTADGQVVHSQVRRKKEVIFKTINL